jgi:hypothetical protein
MSSRPVLDGTFIEPAAPRPRRRLLFPAVAAAALGTAFALGWLGATVLQPPLVLTGVTHLCGCEP